MKSLSRQFVADQEALSRLCHQMAGCERVGLDTEFVGETSFVPSLELVQITAGHLCAAIDVRGVESLQPLTELLARSTVLKILHAGRQDLELFRGHLELDLRPIFDTQVAAAMVGYGTQIGYAQLVQRIVGKTLAKAHTLTNWSQRPLTKEQIAYALADVEFLLPLHEHLRQRLVALGRLQWAEEEFERLLTQPNDTSRDPRRRYERVRGWDSLKSESAAVLRELAAWREQEARQRNLPRGRIIRDEILLELARRKPRTIEDLRGMRGLSVSLVDRHGETLLALIHEGLTTPKSAHPELPRAPKPEPETAGRVDLLQAVLKACAKNAAIAPTLLATAADLQALIGAKEEREQMDLPLLKGWRRQIAGEAILRVLDGHAAVTIDPLTGAVKIS